MWIEDELRGRGYGRRLLTLAEDEAFVDGLAHLWYSHFRGFLGEFPISQWKCSQPPPPVLAVAAARPRCEALVCHHDPGHGPDWVRGGCSPTGYLPGLP